jgi:8-amino-7-oxononanoate synthase
MSLDDDARAELGELEAAHRLRTPRVVDGRQGRVIELDGAAVLNLSSNDYLSLAGDPRIAKAGVAALESLGAGAGASRLISGNHREHVELEREIAAWLGCGGARVFNTGYAANTGVLTALLGPDDVVFSDELNHASIIDGCRLSRAQVVVYPHLELAALAASLQQRHGRRRIVVSESLFSMDGDVVDVEALSALCVKHGAALVLDEAHALGVHGPEGRGIAAMTGTVPDVLVGTFGKALGTFGAFAATTPAIAQLLWNRARPFVFSTGLPPVVSAMTRASLALVRGSDGDTRRRDLERNATRFRLATRARAQPLATAIVPFVVGEDRRAVDVGARLLAAKLHVQAIRPPTVPEGTARLRASVSAGLTTPDLDRAAAAITDALR